MDRNLVAAGAAAAGLSLEDEVLDRLAAFGDLFLHWNERINLGGQIGTRELVEHHLADAFAAGRFVARGSRVVDVGSGGGLPALPLALICTDIRMDLWEPTAKKVSFLRTAIRELNLSGRVNVNAGRIDTAVAGRQERIYDVATSRATFAPAEWLALGRQLIGPDGKVLVFATDKLPVGYPQPASTYRYRDNRQILIFGKIA